MTLLTRHIEAGWREVETNFGKAAERFHARPGATSSVIRVEAETQNKLHEAIDLRQSQLEGTEEPIKDTITNDGTLVTGDQHEALKTDGVTVVGAEQVATPEPNADEATNIAPDATISVATLATSAPENSGSTEEPEAPSPEGAPADAASGEAESQNTPSADTPLTDEERAKLAADEAALESSVTQAPSIPVTGGIADTETVKPTQE